MKHTTYHDEILATLDELANRRAGAAIKADRGSDLEYLGVRTPELRKVVKVGFSFYGMDAAEVLDVWNDTWRHTPYAEVMFAALEYYRWKRKDAILPRTWRVIKGWSARVENWAHADGLAGIYSHVLEANHDLVYPQLKKWSTARSEWLRRLSLVSLVHYSGKNAVFLSPDDVFPIVTNSLADQRHYVVKAVGWVLREMGHVHPDPVESYLRRHAATIQSSAFSRAIQRRPSEEKAELRQMRKEALAAL